MEMPNPRKKDTTKIKNPNKIQIAKQRKKKVESAGEPESDFGGVCLEEKCGS